ncbi:hypothetical protein B0T22DRAFT_462856 [Podospora appendiculata]|uniref:Uncharacterized protein n=1 Tax=Podospora appendiculata TaxID=314037 RepID=A0AAE0XCB9_9PEZI|nr:hypothetical protein B0T22DRAFT_462856 [Podospora appendiculata]
MNKLLCLRFVICVFVSFANISVYLFDRSDFWQSASVPPLHSWAVAFPDAVPCVAVRISIFNHLTDPHSQDRPARMISPATGSLIDHNGNSGGGLESESGGGVNWIDWSCFINGRFSLMCCKRVENRAGGDGGLVTAAAELEVVSQPGGCSGTDVGLETGLGGKIKSSGVARFMAAARISPGAGGCLGFNAASCGGSIISSQEAPSDLFGSSRKPWGFEELATQ